METRQTLPLLWLLSDARNDALLEAALRSLPPDSGFIFRHYHLAPADRRARFAALLAECRALGHVAILADEAGAALQWGADGIYGAPDRMDRREGLLRLATVHDEAEIALANSAGVDGVLLSPVFPTRSHPGAGTLGPDRFRALAALSASPVIALGGMTPPRAQELGWPRWAAIDGLSALEARPDSRSVP